MGSVHRFPRRRIFHPQGPLYQEEQRRPRIGDTLLLLIGVVFPWLVVMAVIFFLVSCTSAYALPHGWDKEDPFVQWVESLKRPPEYQYSCCGLGDLYTIEVIRNATPQQEGEAVITDCSAYKFPDGSFRESCPPDTHFFFSYSEVNLKQDNPKPTAFSFLTIQGGKVTHIWCVIPLPGMF